MKWTDDKEAQKDRIFARLERNRLYKVRLKTYGKLWANFMRYR